MEENKILQHIYVGDTCSYSVFKQLEMIEPDALYLLRDCEGVKSMYKGNDKLGGNFVITNTVPTEDNIESGTIYYIKEYGKTETASGAPFVGLFTNGEWVSLTSTLEEMFHDNEEVIAAALNNLDTRVSELEITDEVIFVYGPEPSHPKEEILYYITEFTDGDSHEPRHFFGIHHQGKWINLNEDWSTEIAKKQDKLIPGHGIEIEDDGTINSTIDVTLYKFVDKLPSVDDPTIEENKIYIVEVVDASGNVELYEYIYHSDTKKWQAIGKNHSQVDLSDYYTQKECNDRFMPKNGRIALQPSGGTNPTIDLLTTGSDGFQALRNVGSSSITGKKLNGAAFGVKLDGTAAFLQKTYDAYDMNTGTKTNACNTAVITFSGPSGFRYAKNSRSSGDVADSDYKYVGIIDSPDSRQCVYSKAKVDELLALQTVEINNLKARVQELENKINQLLS